MCIIAVKLANTKFNNKAEKILQTAIENNNDGTGYSYRQNGKIVLRKGFFDLEELIASLDRQKDLDLNATEIMFHARIRTHGSVSPKTCHPFPNSSSLKQLKQLSTKTKLPVVAHNGVISGQETSKTCSDTMMFIKNYLSSLNHVLKFKSVRKMLGLAISNNKLTIMTLDETYYIGDFIKDNGWIFSNDSYKPRTKTIGYNLGLTKVYNPNKYSKFSYNKPVAYEWESCDWCEELVPADQLQDDPTVANPQMDGTNWVACNDCLIKSVTKPFELI